MRDQSRPVYERDLIVVVFVVCRSKVATIFVGKKIFGKNRSTVIEIST